MVLEGCGAASYGHCKYLARIVYMDAVPKGSMGSSAAASDPSPSSNYQVPERSMFHKRVPYFVSRGVAELCCERWCVLCKAFLRVRYRTASSTVENMGAEPGEMLI